MPSVTPILRGLLRRTPRPLQKPKPPTPKAPQSPPPPSNGPPQTLGGGAPPWIGHPLRVILTTLKFVAFTHLIWEYGISMAPASGPSMLPTFEVLGEWLLVSKLHRFGRNITIGDVVAYSIPINDEVGVKRVLGLEGDYVLMDAPDGDGSEGGRGRGSMIQVPKGHCWIVGDNLVASRDSRYFGPVPLGLIRGKVVATVRPFSEFKWITNPLRRAEQPTET